jgi:hypothetical protein
MKRLLSTATTFLLLFTLSTPLFGQSAGKGALTGTVTDSTGAVVVAAKVTATNIATNISLDTEDYRSRAVSSA